MIFAGPVYLCASWIERKSRPFHRRLPSEMFWDSVKTLPIVIPIAILGVLIYHWLGRQTFIYVVIIVVCLLITFALWWMPYEWVTMFLKRMKIKYNAALVGVLASLPSLVFLSLCIRVFFLYKW